MRDLPDVAEGAQLAAFAGAPVGMLLAAILDWNLLARERPAQRRTRWALAPYAHADGAGLYVRLSSGF